MSRLGTIRNVFVSVLLSLAVLPACSTQGPRHTQEQHESVGRPTRSESTTKETPNTAGQATLVVLLLGIGLAVTALPVVLLVVLL